MSTDVDSGVVQRFRCFQELTDYEAGLAGDDLRLVKLAAGENLFAQGDEGDSMYMVVSGKVELRSALPNGQTSILSTLEGGGIIGEMSFLMKDPRSVTAVALTEAELCRITHADFRESLEEGEAWARKFLLTIAQVLARRLTTLDEQLAEWTGHAGDRDDNTKHTRVAELEELRTRLLSDWSF